jgi:diguanylate cyclase
MANELRKKIEACEIILRRQKTHVTVSIGVAAFPKDARAKDDLIFKADEALYQAKETGRNKVCAA